MSSTDLAQLGVAVIAAVVVAVRAFASRGTTRTPATRWLTWLLTVTVVALIVGWPPLMHALAGDGGGLIALRVVQHCCVLGMALAFLAFAEHATRTSPRTARRVVRLASVVAVFAGAVMVATAAVGAVGLPEAPPLHLLTPDHASSPAIAVYLIAYAVPIGPSVVEVGIRCGAVARRPGRPLYRSAMALFVLGCAAGAAYSVLRVAGTVATATGGAFDAAAVSFPVTLIGIGCVLAGSGLVGVNRLV
ncbi:MAG TPA: hypothetical protein VGF17_02675 [Phytomonospora sp.]